jgi:polyferredoxin
MMEAVNLPKGLIRYTSEERIQTREKFKLSARGWAYSALLIILAGVLVGLLSTRSDIETNILRTQGMLYQTQEDGSISNLYNYKIINKTNEDIDVHLAAMEDGYKLKLIGDQPKLKMQGTAQGVFFLSAMPEQFELGKAETQIGVYDQNDELIDKVDVRITGPL